MAGLRRAGQLAAFVMLGQKEIHTGLTGGVNQSEKIGTDSGDDLWRGRRRWHGISGP